jgi:hypothetical protein
MDEIDRRPTIAEIEQGMSKADGNTIRQAVYENEYPVSLVASLLLAQPEIKNLAKDEEGQIGTSRKYMYTTLGTIREEVTEILAKFGLAITSKTKYTDSGAFLLYVKLLHVSGEYEEAEWPLPANATAQQMGSAITYGRRYCTQALLNLASEDDDGAEASKAKPASRRGPVAASGRAHGTGSRATSEPAPSTGSNSESEPSTTIGSSRTSEPSSSTGPSTASELVSLEDWDKELAIAAATGSEDELRRVWHLMPPDAQKSMKAALERRHKPACQEAHAVLEGQRQQFDENFVDSFVGNE